MKNPKSKDLTFQQKHISHAMQHKLNYLFISNNVQKFVEK